MDGVYDMIRKLHDDRKALKEHFDHEYASGRKPTEKDQKKMEDLRKMIELLEKGEFEIRRNDDLSDFKKDR